MDASNVLFLMPDEHSREVLGCYGNPVVRTPNLDALAARGTLFENAYCNSPICIPSRAAVATGQYPHATGYWDNAEPYDGKVRSWGHSLSERGHEVVSVGKLHFRHEDDDAGFSRQIIPMHVVDGKGDLHGLLRRPPRNRPGTRRLAQEIGPGESTYTQYDRQITEETCRWLREREGKPADKPWVLFVSLVCPHFPLLAPKEFFDLYPVADVPWPKLRDPADQPGHPVLQAFRRYQNYEDYFTSDEQVRTAVASYYALVSFVDHQVGTILRTLADAGLEDTTRVIYTSDHGDNLGSRGYWGKSLLFEESCGVPMIVSGPGVEQGKRVGTPVSLVDVYPTIVQATGEKLDATETAVLPGRSLLELAATDEPEREVFAEYHAVGAVTGCFMLRYGKWKYTYYVGHPPQLFDLEADPLESRDLAGDPDHAGTLRDAEARLRRIVDPEAATQQAFDDQDRVIAANGGEAAILGRGEFPHTPAPGRRPHTRRRRNKRPRGAGRAWPASAHSAPEKFEDMLVREFRCGGVEAPALGEGPTVAGLEMLGARIDAGSRDGVFDDRPVRVGAGLVLGRKGEIGRALDLADQQVRRAGAG